MHRARRLGGVFDAGFLVNRQRVHVCAQPDHLAAAVGFTLDHADNASAANAGHDFIAAEFL
jgi:hypothetical protein